MCEDLLREQLAEVKYYDSHRMTNYCEEFRKVESQIYDMAFADRLRFFTDNLKSPKVTLHIKNSDSIKSKKMNMIYKLIREWARNYRLTSFSSHHHHHRSNKPVLHFDKTKHRNQPKSAPSKPESEDDLDYIPDELNVADMKEVK